MNKLDLLDKLNFLEDLRVPLSTLKVLLRMAKAMVALLPEQANASVETSGAKLAVFLALVDEALTRRLRELNPELLIHAMVFDRAVDGLWVLLRRRLEDPEAFLHAGLDALPEELVAKTKLDALREGAVRARKLHARLFGAEGTNFVKLRYLEQAESMAAILRLIESDELADELAEFVGPELHELLAVCQLHYEAVVDARLSKESGSNDDLRVMTARLRRLLYRYKNALTSWADEDEPETIAAAWTALLPMVTVRAHLARSGGADEDLLIAALDELEGGEGDEADEVALLESSD